MFIHPPVFEYIHSFVLGLSYSTVLEYRNQMCLNIAKTVLEYYSHSFLFGITFSTMTVFEHSQSDLFEYITQHCLNIDTKNLLCFKVEPLN